MAVPALRPAMVWGKSEDGRSQFGSSWVDPAFSFFLGGRGAASPASAPLRALPPSPAGAGVRHQPVTAHQFRDMRNGTWPPRWLLAALAELRTHCPCGGLDPDADIAPAAAFPRRHEGRAHPQEVDPPELASFNRGTRRHRLEWRFWRVELLFLEQRLDLAEIWAGSLPCRRRGGGRRRGRDDDDELKGRRGGRVSSARTVAV
jgi:hypothetical protein